MEVEEEGVRHSVTPLWCAAVSGRLAVVRQLPLSHQHRLYQNIVPLTRIIPLTFIANYWLVSVAGCRVLLSHGADVNAVSDSGSTSVRSVCYIVRPGLDTW